MNVLAVGAHHDDIEIGCAGTIAKLKKHGNRVYGIILTNSETHFGAMNIHRTAVEAEREAIKASAEIGLELCEMNYPKVDNGMLVYDINLMREIEKFIFDNDIELILTHWRYDMNTDHETASKISIVAARHVHNIFMYQSNWYQPDRAFNGIAFSDISDFMEQKKQSLNQYKIEIQNRGKDWINSFIDRNRSYGFSIGVKYAEVFEAVRYIIR
jgi:N-acetylglucosamine malate deacetylase 1